MSISPHKVHTKLLLFTCGTEKRAQPNTELRKINCQNGRLEGKDLPVYLSYLPPPPPPPMLPHLNTDLHNTIIWVNIYKQRPGAVANLQNKLRANNYFKDSPQHEVFYIFISCYSTCCMTLLSCPDSCEIPCPFPVTSVILRVRTGFRHHKNTYLLRITVVFDVIGYNGLEGSRCDSSSGHTHHPSVTRADYKEFLQLATDGKRKFQTTIYSLSVVIKRIQYLVLRVIYCIAWHHGDAYECRVLVK